LKSKHKNTYARPTPPPTNEILLKKTEIQAVWQRIQEG